MMTGEAAFLGFSPFDILVDRTRVAALSICPISQGTFVCLNFLAYFFKDFFFFFFLKLSMIFFGLFKTYLSEFISLRL